MNTATQPVSHDYHITTSDRALLERNLQSLRLARSGYADALARRTVELAAIRRAMSELDDVIERGELRLVMLEFDLPEQPVVNFYAIEEASPVEVYQVVGVGKHQPRARRIRGSSVLAYFVAFAVTGVFIYCCLKY